MLLTWEHLLELPPRGWTAFRPAKSQKIANGTICHTSTTRAQPRGRQRLRPLSRAISGRQDHRLLSRRIATRGNLRAHPDGPCSDRAYVRGSRGRPCRVVCRRSDRDSFFRIPTDKPFSIDRAIPPSGQSAAHIRAPYCVVTDTPAPHPLSKTCRLWPPTSRRRRQGKMKTKTKTKLGFGKRGHEETEKTARGPTLIGRLKTIGRRWWRGHAPHDNLGAKLRGPRGLPQRRP